MAKNTLKGFVELHSARTGNPILIKIDMIGFMFPVTEDDKDRYNRYATKKAVDWTHVTSLAHNNGGFDVKESYTKVIELIRQAQEA